MDLREGDIAFKGPESSPGRALTGFLARPAGPGPYPGSVHSFTNERLPLAYNAEASRDAWERTLSFFAEHL